MPRINQFSLSTLLWFAASTFVLPVKAHDTWFVPGDAPMSYHLNTGSHFPQLGGAVPFSRVGGSGCLSPGGESTSVIGRGSGNEFIVSIAGADATTHTICWASLHRRSINLNAREVKQYLAETRADRQWEVYYDELQAQGRSWVESYRKSARIELTSALSDSMVDLPLQARLAPAASSRVAMANQAITLQVLLNNKPLPDQPVELLIDNAPFGVWYETDEKGLIEVVPPVAGQALLRGTHFSIKNDLVRTEFLTYTFPVAQ